MSERSIPCHLCSAFSALRTLHSGPRTTLGTCRLMLHKYSRIKTFDLHYLQEDATAVFVRKSSCLGSSAPAPFNHVKRF